MRILPPIGRVRHSDAGSRRFQPGSIMEKGCAWVTVAAKKGQAANGAFSGED